MGHEPTAGPCDLSAGEVVFGIFTVAVPLGDVEELNIKLVGTSALEVVCMLLMFSVTESILLLPPTLLLLFLDSVRLRGSRLPI